MDQPVSRTRTALARKLAIDISVMVVIGVVLALIGPFGSFAMPLAIRLVSWVAFALLGYVLYSPMGPLVNHLHRALDLPLAGLWLAACMAATVPMTIVVWVMGFVPGPVPLPTLEQALAHYFYVFVIGGGVTALFVALEQRKQAGAAPASVSGAALTTPVSVPDPAPVPPGPRFLDRLPAALGSDLIALEMEDHYVRAHTALGSELVLMRLRDAVAELDGIEGMQVHRSWWVARHAVEGVQREGRNLRLVLAGGLQAPVARANVAPLKDAGWI